MAFLQAEWRKLALANYEIEPDLLRPFLPPGTEIDLWKGHCFASLVGFMFLETRVLGLKIPFHVHFEEVNLRFYVRRKVGDEWRRGVVFIKEIVPRRAIAWVANGLYNENYERLPMRHFWGENGERRTVRYEWKKGDAWQIFEVEADVCPTKIEADSDAEFITEHYFGYAKTGEKTANEYEVAHPRWEQYAVCSHRVEVDFGCLYGERFAFLNEKRPNSVMLAEGSAIEVMGKTRITEKAVPPKNQA